MATIHKNLSEIGTELPSAADMRIGIVVSEWNEQITGALLEGAVRTLKNAGCDEQNIEVKRVPGRSNFPSGAVFRRVHRCGRRDRAGLRDPGRDAAFRLCGCQGVTQGVTQLMLSWNMPVAFGVLTTENLQQAIDRAGGKYGNKGDEAAAAVIKMIALQIEMEPEETEADRKKIN